MKILELIIIAFGLSMDAFAVAVCRGLSMQKTGFKKALIVGLYFGIFQAVMPLIGYFIGSQFSDMIVSFDHWIAFALLILIGLKMIIESFKKNNKINTKCEDEACFNKEFSDKITSNKEQDSLRPSKMLLLALATSIDALAIGVTFAFLEVNIFAAVSLIGVITLVLSMAGVKIGSVFGVKLKSKAEFIGGLILILMGIKIVLEHMNIISF